MDRKAIQKMTTLDSALELAKKGFHVFPLRPKSKLPAIDDFPHKATTDVDEIKKMWMDPVLGIEQPYNVGISTTHFGTDEALIVVDVDMKDERNGEETVLKLELEGMELPLTLEQVTPTGGRHLIYKSKKTVQQGHDKLGVGVDIRSWHGYIVGAGSVLEHGEYTVIERSIIESPEWLISKLGRVTMPEQKKAPKNINKTRARERAAHYLQNESKPSIEGQGGQENAFKTAARIKDFGVSEAECLDLMLEFWNPTCVPEWSTSDLHKIVNNAYKYGRHEVGASSPEADFSKAPPTEEQKSFLAKLNDEYALVYVEGGHFILHETVDEKGREKRNFLTELTFKRRFSPKTVQSGKGRPHNYAEIWLDWEGRREYAGLCFAPGREPRHNYYNLWRGWMTEPILFDFASPEQVKGLTMFLEHAKENVCGGDEKLFNWLMGYFAHMIQRPWERPLTTLVFKGKKGTGKNALVERIGRLLGPNHYLVAHDGRYLTSNFNGHLDSCLMLVLDEAFWSGDKAAEGKLKGLTTSPEIMIERKGKEPYMVDNLVRLIVIGNEEWLVPASQDERRYAVFQMGEGKKQNVEFFKTMRILLDEKGGAGLLLNYLMQFDLSKVDVNVAPKTEALLEQKLRSLSPLEQWWYESLVDGYLLNSDFNDEWPERISKDSFIRAYTQYCQSRNIRPKFADSHQAIGRRIKAICPSIDGEQKTKDANKRVRAFVLPSLDQARKEWVKYIGQEVKWL
jgi:hypothetical protein